jgi:hypothetical protein
MNQSTKPLLMKESSKKTKANAPIIPASHLQYQMFGTPSTSYHRTKGEPELKKNTLNTNSAC